VVLLLHSRILGMVLDQLLFEALFRLLTTSKKPVHTFPSFHVSYVLLICACRLVKYVGVALPNSGFK